MQRPGPTTCKRTKLRHTDPTDCHEHKSGWAIIGILPAHPGESRDGVPDG